MKSYTKRITSVVLSLTIAVGATSFTKFSNVNAQETPLAPQEPSVLNEENADLEINDLAGLVAFRDIVNSSTKYKGKTVVLNADIDMSSIDNWDAIGRDGEIQYGGAKPFTGTFNGNNHKISNLKINNSEHYQGLFGYTIRATIQNLGLENVNVKGYSYLGGLVGYNKNGGTIENCYVTGSVTGVVTHDNDPGGGLVGYNDGGTIENCYVIGSVTGTDWTGRLVGINNNGTIRNSYAAGEVTGIKVGGLVGNNSYGSVINSYYDKYSVGQSDTEKGTPLSTTQMTGDNAKTNMTGFDFENIWGTKISGGGYAYYPYLKNFGSDSATHVEAVITEINTIENLIEFRDNVNSGITYEGKTVALNTDIDMSSIDNWNAIGTYTSSTNNKPFKGTFKGNNHKISNLKINKYSEENQGLFGYIEGGTIENIGEKNAKVNGQMNVGSLVGLSDGGTIKNSYATGEVTGSINFVGGLVGQIKKGTVENSYGAVDVTGRYNYVGGLVGTNGGTIKNSYGAGKVTGGYNYVGGLVGFNGEGTTIENSYAIGEIKGKDEVGGLVGRNEEGTTIKNSYAIGEIKGKDEVGGLVGNNDGTVTNSYYDKDTTGQSDTGKGTPLSTKQMKGEFARTNMTGFDFNSTWGIKTGTGAKVYYPYLQNFGADSAPCIQDVEIITEINTIEDLIWFRDNVNSGIKYEEVTVNLNADIDMSGIDNWDAIGTCTSFADKKPFKGTFNGNNHKISNLKIDKEEEYYQGLFGFIEEGSTIQNLGVENANVKGRSFVGGSVGYNEYGTIKNSYATGTVNGEFDAGGLVGSNKGGKIENSYGAVDVTGIYDYVGGLVGNNGGTIKNSYGVGKVTGGYDYVGGLVGFNGEGTTIENSYAIGEIKGKDKVGGLVGDNDGTVTNSYYDKDRTGQSDTGKGTPLSTTQMIGDNAKTNMIGFDFSSVWSIRDNEGEKGYYPYLKNFGEISEPFIELK